MLSVDLIRPASAFLTAGLARKAPRTSKKAIVSRANSGETSSAMLARPSTLISSVSPAARTASRSLRAKCCSPRTSSLRTTVWRTASACVLSWLRIAVRMKSVRFW